MVVDHLGNKFKTDIDMCKHWNVPYKTFKSRIYRGSSLKRALTDPVGQRNSKFVTDHLGNKFNSIKEMCKHWGIPYNNLEIRLKQGWSLKDALEKPLKFSEGNTPVEDHLGNKFNSYQEMCNHWGISYPIFKYRIQRWDLKKTLETPIREKDSSLVVRDHLGNKFKNKREMCRYWGISHVTFYNRINRGWTLKETLETKTLSKQE